MVGSAAIYGLPALYILGRSASGYPATCICRALSRPSTSRPRLLPNPSGSLTNMFDGFYYKDGRRTEEKREDLGSWALVCLDWARRCRGLLHTRVEITSGRSALRFRALVKGPCSDRLTPLLDLIGTLNVWTDPDIDKWSWHHHLTTIAPAVPADKFGKVHILLARLLPTSSSSFHFSSVE